jgi:hypothetical protein
MSTTTSLNELPGAGTDHAGAERSGLPACQTPIPYGTGPSLGTGTLSWLRRPRRTPIPGTTSRRGPALAGLILLVAGGAIAVIEHLRGNLLEVVPAAGAALLCAGVARRRRDQATSGGVLLGLGAGLLIAEDAGLYAYQYYAALVGAGLALVVLRGPAWAAGRALLGLGLVATGITWLPSRLPPASAWRPLTDGWGFGILLALYGAGVMVMQVRRGDGRRTG